MTTMETLIAIGIAALVLTQVCSLWFYSIRSFAAQASYASLDQDSQRALDQLSRDVRQATNLVAYSTNAVVLRDLNGQLLSFGLTNRTLTRVKGASRTVLLKDCDWLNFQLFQRNPVEGAYDQYPAADLVTCKLLEVRWRCSRQPYPTSPETTEYMQSAKIVLRSK